MKTPSPPLPAWLKWLLRLFGIILVLGSLYLTVLVVIALIGVFHVFLGPKGHALSDKQWEGLFAGLLGRLVGQILLLLLGIWLLRWPRKKNNEEAEISRLAPVQQTVVPAASSFSTAARNKRWSSCNILHVGTDAYRLWQFDAKGDGFALTREHGGAPGEPLPFNLVAKSWRSLWQPKLNVAWLPPENVFLRVIELPKINFEETLAMVELQLEKLSPIPVAQVVWMIHVLPQTTGNLQIVIVVIAARNAVEEFLGKLEGQDYLADRLEAPMLDELEATPVTEDGTWIYPATLTGQNVALVAWWCGGALRNLSFIVLPPTGDRAKSLKDQLAQLTWAGELEGWLTAPPNWHLVADGGVATEWESVLLASLGEPVQVTQPLPFAELAARTARRSTQTDVRATLLPAEFSARYHQQFVDRLWLRGLVATGILYAVCVVIYFCATTVLGYRTHQVEQQVAALNGSYTNALQLKARYDVLKERQDLKYAALDCWKIVAEQLPAGISLQRMSFADGQKLSLNGTVASDQVDLITEKDGFYDRVRKAKLNGQPMFDTSGGEDLTYQQRDDSVSWRFSLALRQKPEEAP
jgi:hypothetical protein